MNARLLLVALAVVPACTPVLTDGRYACTAGSGASECPPGYLCVGSRCRAGSGTDCRYDYECEQPCTDDACDNGFCTHDPSPADEGSSCDDRTFCNGPDVCTDGTCAPVGAPPCPGVCEEGVGCADCGAPGQACCRPECPVGAVCLPFCYPGSECDTSSGPGTCRVCGDSVGAACCGGNLCAAGLACDYSTLSSGLCAECGDEGELCCLGGVGIEGGPEVPPCTMPLECVPSTDGTPRCALCGEPGQPCCAAFGCRTGYCDANYLCTTADCSAVGTSCPTGTICAPRRDDGGAFTSAPECLNCGMRGSPCCPPASGQPACPPDLGCFAGYCLAGAMPAR
jgi:hypothetical protein